MLQLVIVTLTKQRVTLPPMLASNAIKVFLDFKLGSHWPMRINGRKMRVADVELSCL